MNGMRSKEHIAATTRFPTRSAEPESIFRLFELNFSGIMGKTAPRCSPSADDRNAPLASNGFRGPPCEALATAHHDVAAEEATDGHERENDHRIRF